MERTKVEKKGKKKVIQGTMAEAAKMRVVMPEGTQEQRRPGDRAGAAEESMVGKKQRAVEARWQANSPEWHGGKT